MKKARHKKRSISSFPSLSPLRGPIFRALWIATIASNLGTWMQDVGESWLMVSFTNSPILVALVETAGDLPIVLLGLPAGAIADLLDRHKLLLVTQTWMLAVATWLLFTWGMVRPKRRILSRNAFRRAQHRKLHYTSQNFDFGFDLYRYSVW